MDYDSRLGRMWMSSIIEDERRRKRRARSNGTGTPDYVVTSSAELATALADANADYIQIAPAGFTHRSALSYPRNGLKIEGPITVLGSDLVTGWVQETAAAEETGGLFASGMETASFTDWTTVDTTGVASVTRVSSPSPAHGSFCARLLANGTATDNRGGLHKTITAHAINTTRYYRAYVYIPTGSLGAGTQIKFLNIGTNNYGTIECSGGVPTGLSAVGGNGGVFLGSFPTAAITRDAWHCIEWMYTVSATVGGCAFWVDGVSVARTGGASFTFDTSAAAGSTDFFVGNSGFSAILAANQSIYFDDAKADTSQIGLFSAGDARRWTKTSYAGTTPNQIYVDGARYDQRATAAEVVTASTWDITTTTLTICRPTATATAPVVEVSVRKPVDFNGKSNCTLTGATIRYAYEEGVNVSGADNPTVTGNTITDCFVEAVYGYTATAKRGGTISGNTISRVGGCGISHSGYITNAVITSNNLDHCSQLHDGLVGGHVRQQWSAGIKVWGDAMYDQMGSLTVTDNTHTDHVPQFSAGSNPNLRGHGDWLDDIHFTVTSSYLLNVAREVIIRCPSIGIYIEKADCTLVDDCVVDYRGVTPNNFNGPIHLETNDAPANRNVGSKARHCTTIGGYWGAALNAGATSFVLSSARFENCIFGPPTTNPQSLYASTNVNDTTHGIGCTVDHCNFGADRANMAQANGSNYASAAALQAGKAWVTASIVGDPLFVNSAIGNLRLQAGSPCKSAASDGTDLGATAATLARAAAIA